MLIFKTSKSECTERTDYTALFSSKLEHITGNSASNGVPKQSWTGRLIGKYILMRFLGMLFAHDFQIFWNRTSMLICEINLRNVLTFHKILHRLSHFSHSRGLNQLFSETSRFQHILRNKDWLIVETRFEAEMSHAFKNMIRNNTTKS